MVTHAICWIKYFVKPLHEIWIMVNLISLVFLVISGLVNYENFSDSPEWFLGKLWSMYLEGRGIIWILEINIMKFKSNIMLLNMLVIKGTSYWYLFSWREHGISFSHHELCDDKTAGCNFWKPKQSFCCADSTHSLPLCSRLHLQVNGRNLSSLLNMHYYFFGLTSLWLL
jgi:hypothetical protein